MYINFHKYNYSLEAATEREAFIKRDKDAYKSILLDWFNNNLVASVERKWEVEEIFYLKQISDFIKLLREAESLYELGFFTGCVALVGISAEDFSRYLSLQAGRNNHIQTTSNSGRVNDVSQSNRLQMQLSDGLIDNNVFTLLDVIRIIRNDCLHYNQAFKQKNDAELKDDALKVLNNLKAVLKIQIGTTLAPDVNEFIRIIKEMAAGSEDVRNLDELIMKQRNAFSHLFNLGYAQHPDKKQQYNWDAFTVLNVDDDEIDLKSIFSELVVTVDLDDEFRAIIKNKKIGTNSLVFAQITSKLDKFGQTGLWHFVNLL